MPGLLFAGVNGQVRRKEVTSGDVFGTRAYLKNNYLYRMAAAVLGIYGNSKEEAMYPIYPSMPPGKSSTAPTATRCTLRRASCRPSMRSGR